MKHRKMVTKVIIIALRGRHRVTLIQPIYFQNNKSVRRIFFLHCIPATVAYKTCIEHFLAFSTHSQKNKEQSRHPQLFGPFSSSRYALHFCIYSQTIDSYKLIFLGDMKVTEIYVSGKKKVF